MEEGDFVCRDCGTIDSPEWRKVSPVFAFLAWSLTQSLPLLQQGPDGPKSLCNACGKFRDVVFETPFEFVLIVSIAFFRTAICETQE